VNPKFTGAPDARRMDRARRLQTTARWLLVAAALICAIGMIGPFQGVERALVPWDKAAHFIAFYGVTLLLFSAFPDRRRLDLAVLATFAGTAVEVLQLIDGRDAELGDVLADAAGAFAVLAPIYLERLREPRADRRKRRAASVPAAETEPA
jgi:VanZ family protein